jgi:cell division protein ZapA
LPIVQIEILGKRYALQSDRDPAHVRSVAAYVDSQLREVSGNRPSAVQRDHAILAALNIASELFLVRERGQDLALTLDRRLQSLVTLLDQSAGGGDVTSAGPNRS